MTPIKLRLFSVVLALVSLLFTAGCKQDPGTVTSSEPETGQVDSAVTPTTNGPLFRMLSSGQTGILFSNNLIEDGVRNYFQYMYFYNGGGVAVGDLNDDGLPDLFFTGNMVENRLYKNLGNMQFEDVTIAAGVSGPEGWYTGTTLADVNADGLLDIYVCRSGLFEESARTNLLYINQGDFHFKEAGAEYGLADPGWSTQATFFDYDMDGDLDCYLVNHPIDFEANILEKQNFAKNPDPRASDKLYRNVGGKFTDVTRQARVENYGFGLSATAGDLNNDGKPDLYVANDFAEPDFLYLNLPLGNSKGGRFFQDFTREATGHISNFGMGVDIADLNNDGLLDIIEMDMMAEDNRRKKTNMSGMDPLSFYYNVGIGYHYQYMQNTVQLNLGIMPGKPVAFSEIAELAGVSQTDWSWAPLAADFDNDGWKDLFITNGMRREMRDNDFLKWMKEKKESGLPINFGEVLQKVPVEKLDNYIYRNQGNLQFEKVNGKWSLSFPGFSQGAAYADLDNDGDLDLVVNNLDEEAKIFENRHRQETDGHYLRIKLTGPIANPFALGSRVKLYTNGGFQMQELTLTRGYQSSVEPILHFGLGTHDQVKKVEVLWPDGTLTQLANVAADQVREVIWEPNGTPAPLQETGEPLFEEKAKRIGLGFAHKETPFDDFEAEILLPHKYSQLGPALATGDVNGDGLEDLFVGGAAGQQAVIYLQKAQGVFTPQPVSNHLTEAEDLGALFFDADGDGHLDLYIATGGNEKPIGDPAYLDQLLINDGKGNFSSQGAGALALEGSHAAVAAADIDQDGDLDLFVGGRNVPGKYLARPESYLLINQGDGTFIKGERLKDLGMVTAAVWCDFDQDADPDLVLAGEWMPITILRNKDGKLLPQSKLLGLGQSQGWWYSLAVGDFDKDGDPDLIAGNLGLNTKYKASIEGPFQAHAHDFDGNGTHDIVLSYYQNGTHYPVRGRTCSSQQMPFIAQQFPTYNQFATSPLIEIYELDSAAYAEKAHTFSTSLIRNDGDKFSVHPLPVEAQFGPVNGIVVGDFNLDGNPDLAIAGNMLHTEVETARHDGNFGRIFLGDGKGGFTPLTPQASGFFAPGDVKALQKLALADGKYLLVAGVNDGKLQAFRSILKKMQ